MAYLSGWNQDNRIKYKIPSSLVDADLTWYPVMIKTSLPIDLANNRKKIAVTKGDGTTQLNVEIQYWNDLTGEIILNVSKSDWVISSINDTYLYLYYDETQSNNFFHVGDIGEAQAQEVWDNNFVMVHHMGDELYDATGNYNHGTNNGSTVVDGLNGKARHFDDTSVNFDNGQSLLGSGSITNTVQILVKPDSSALTEGAILIGGQQIANERYYFGFRADGGLDLGFGATAWDDVSNLTIDEDYNILSMRVVAGVPKLYKGSSLADTGSTDTAVNFGTDVFSVGGYYNAGTLDTSNCGANTINEVRISNIARSDSWISADDYNLRTNTLVQEVIEVNTSNYSDSKEFAVSPMDVGADLPNYPAMVKLYDNSASTEWDETTNYALDDIVKNKGSHYRLKVDFTYENVALSKTVTTNGTENASYPMSRVTDGNLDTTVYAASSAGTDITAEIDLGNIYEVDEVKVWHYYSDGRTYYGTRTEVSEDGIVWETIFDSAVSGTYAETSAGKTHTFTARKVRYIRDFISGSTSNTGNHWVEIQVFGSLIIPEPGKGIGWENSWTKLGHDFNFNSVKTDGSDIVFTNTSGELLDFERAHYYQEIQSYEDLYLYDTGDRMVVNSGDWVEEDSGGWTEWLAEYMEMGGSGGWDNDIIYTSNFIDFSDIDSIEIDINFLSIGTASSNSTYGQSASISGALIHETDSAQNTSIFSAGSYCDVGSSVVYDDSYNCSRTEGLRQTIILDTSSLTGSYRVRFNSGHGGGMGASGTTEMRLHSVLTKKTAQYTNYTEDFESGIGSWTTTSSSITQSSTRAHSGTYSLRIDSTGALANGNRDIEEYMIEHGSTKVSFWFNIDAEDADDCAFLVGAYGIHFERETQSTAYWRYPGADLATGSATDKLNLDLANDVWYKVEYFFDGVNSKARLYDASETLVMEHTKDLSAETLISGTMGYSDADGGWIFYIDDVAIENAINSTSESKGTFHIRLPMLSSTEETRFNMYYGNESAIDLQNPTGVWDTVYAGVWHLGDTITDSTSNGNNGTGVNTVVTDGINGKALKFNGSSSHVSLPNVTSDSQPHTVQAIAKSEIFMPTTTASTSRRTLYVSPGPVWNPGLWMTNSFIRHHAQGQYADNSTIDAGTDYQMFGGRYNGTSVNNIFNEALIPSSTTAYAPTYSSTLLIGNDTTGSTTYCWNGTVEEFRIANTALSDDWIAADDKNLRTYSLVDIYDPTAPKARMVNETYTDNDIIDLSWTYNWSTTYYSYSNTATVNTDVEFVLNNWIYNKDKTITLNMDIYSNTTITRAGSNPGDFTYNSFAEWIVKEPDAPTEEGVYSSTLSKVVTYNTSGTIAHSANVTLLLPETFSTYDHQDWQIVETMTVTETNTSKTQTWTKTYDINIIEELFKGNAVFFSMNF